MGYIKRALLFDEDAGVLGPCEGDYNEDELWWLQMSQNAADPDDDFDPDAEVPFGSD